MHFQIRSNLCTDRHICRTKNVEQNLFQHGMIVENDKRNILTDTNIRL
jgi:hypothetical protein